MINRETVKSLFRLAARFVKFSILHVDDSPHRIALGVALGFFIAFLPFIGFHMLLALLFSFILKANKVVGILSTLICNPLTIVPILFSSYLLGKRLMFFFDQAEPASSEDIHAVLSSLSFGNIISRIGTSQLWTDLGPLFGRVGIELCVGCAVLGILAAIAGYFATHSLVVSYRKKHPHIKLRKP